MARVKERRKEANLRVLISVWGYWDFIESIQ